MATILAILVVTVAIAAPWATISAFESSRFAGWTVTFVAVMAHVATWCMMASSKEVAFFCAAPWAAYEFVLSLIPMGIGEIEEEKAAASAAAANKG